MKKLSTAFAVWEMQIKTNNQKASNPVKIAVIKTTTKNAGENVEEQEIVYVLGKNVN